MSMTNRAVLGCLGVIALVLVGTGTLVVLNWDAVSKNLDETYDTGTGDRILGISFSNCQLPGKLTSKGHAREIVAFAIGKTTKFEQIDA